MGGRVSGSFLETTVIIELADQNSSANYWAKDTVTLNKPSQVPIYAFRELLSLAHRRRVAWLPIALHPIILLLGGSRSNSLRGRGALRLLS